VEEEIKESAEKCKKGTIDQRGDARVKVKTVALLEGPVLRCVKLCRWGY